jgi:uncharacterized protein (TIGR03083 family)
MADIDIWPVVHDERAALAADLTSASLGEQQWSGPSQCDGWTVRDVLAHMTATATMTPAKFFPKMIASGFSFDKVQDKGIAAERGASGAETLSRFQAVIGSEKKPPGPKDTVLGETIIHAEDLRRPRGLRRTSSSGRSAASTAWRCGPPTPAGPTAPVPRCRARCSRCSSPWPGARAR